MIELKISNGFVIESFRGVKNPDKTYAQIKLDGSTINLQSTEFDLTTMPKFEELNLLVSCNMRVYDRNQVIYVKDIKRIGSGKD